MSRLVQSIQGAFDVGEFLLSSAGIDGGGEGAEKVAGFLHQRCGGVRQTEFLRYNLHLRFQIAVHIRAPQDDGAVFRLDSDTDSAVARFIEFNDICNAADSMEMLGRSDFFILTDCVDLVEEDDSPLFTERGVRRVNPHFARDVQNRSGPRENGIKIWRQIENR